MKAKQPKAYQEKQGYRGILATVEIYEQLRKGEVDWKDSIKANIKKIELPAEVFFRLLELDRDMTKCAMPDGIEILPDGEHPMDPCVYKIKEVHRNVTVTVSECKNCGSVDISWTKQEDTDSEYMEE